MGRQETGAPEAERSFQNEGVVNRTQGHGEVEEDENLESTLGFRF